MKNNKDKFSKELFVPIVNCIQNKKYNEALSKLIIKNPKRFLLLCRVHHHYIEWGRNITRKSPEKFIRFVDAVHKTKT